MYIDYMEKCPDMGQITLSRGQTFYGRQDVSCGMKTHLFTHNSIGPGFQRSPIEPRWSVGQERVRLETHQHFYRCDVLPCQRSNLKEYHGVWETLHSKHGSRARAAERQRTASNCRTLWTPFSKEAKNFCYPGLWILLC